MNLILFSPEELEKPLSTGDPRADHILNILKVKPGQTFDVGKINGPRGKATLEAIEESRLKLSYSWRDEIPSLPLIDLWVSFCRPQTCRRILQECTSLGVRSFTFFDTEKCEPTYRNSRLWSSGEASRLLRRGAEQAFCTRIPEVIHESTLESALVHLPSKSARLALDNYESSISIGNYPLSRIAVTLAVGGERGWSPRERHLLRGADFQLVDLGERVLRTETACIAALSILSHQISQLLTHP